MVSRLVELIVSFLLICSSQVTCTGNGQKNPSPNADVRFHHNKPTSSDHVLSELLVSSLNAIIP